MGREARSSAVPRPILPVTCYTELVCRAAKLALSRPPSLILSPQWVCHMVLCPHAIKFVSCPHSPLKGQVYSAPSTWDVGYSPSLVGLGPGGCRPGLETTPPLLMTFGPVLVLPPGRSGRIQAPNGEPCRHGLQIQLSAPGLLPAPSGYTGQPSHRVQFPLPLSSHLCPADS